MEPLEYLINGSIAICVSSGKKSKIIYKEEIRELKTLFRNFDRGSLSCMYLSLYLPRKSFHT